MARTQMANPFCSFGARAGVQPTLHPCAETFYKQTHCASPGREGVWLMMSARVCVTEG